MEFTRQERIAVLVLGLVSGFVIGFSSLATINGALVSLDYTTGLLTLLIICFGMVVSVLWHETAHKLAAQYTGYYTHIENYPAGLVIGAALSLFTFGWVQFYTPNTTDLEANPRARIAKHRKYENPKQQAFISIAGIFATGLLAIALYGLWVGTNEELFHTLLRGNIWIMLYSLIPFELISLVQLKLFQNIEQIPQSDGLYLLGYSKYAWVFAASFAVTLSAILYFTQSFAVWLAVALAFCATFGVWWHFFKDAK